MFNEKLQSMKINHSGNNQVIYYSGTGGVGKTALIQELEKDLIAEIDDNFQKFKYVSYNFTPGIGAEMLTVLTALKNQLFKAYGIKFPFFEEGLFDYYQKRGDVAGILQLENALKGTSFMDETIQHFYSMNNFGHVSKNFFNESFGVVNMVSDTIPVLQVLKSCAKFVGNRIKDMQKIRLEKHPMYRANVEELRKREKEFNPEAVKEYLPTLFAKDVSYWLRENDCNLVIFLDTYEQLTADESDSKRHERLIYEGRDVPVDWWLEDLFKHTNRALWIIAGRGAINTIGENVKVNQENQIFHLDALKNKFADEFLKQSGINDNALRKGIIELTGGYPIYLALCVNTYKKIQQNKVPTLEDFGENRKSVIHRLLAFMNDTTRLMVYRLCILGIWTDSLAAKILLRLNEYNPDAYNRVKKLSFVTMQKLDDKELFIFDRAIQKILLDYLKSADAFSVLVPQTRDVINEIFKKIFSDQSEGNLELYFRIWSRVILNTSANANDLMTQYEKNLSPSSSMFDKAIQKDIIKKFQIAIKNSDTKIPGSYFENLIAQINFSEGNDKDFLKLAKIAYEKIAGQSVLQRLNFSIPNICYGMALFYAMGTHKDTDEYKNFADSFRFAINRMSTTEKEILLANYGQILKSLSDVYRKNNELIDLLDNTINFINADKKSFGKCLNKFLLNLQLYKLTALSHLGKIKEFQQSADEFLENLEKNLATGNNLELYLIYKNRLVVNLQDTFNYAGSLKIGNEVLNEIKDLLYNKDENFAVYKDQYFRLCGSLALTCYLTLNKSHKNLELARHYSDIALKGFTLDSDKMRQYQLRAQIEAEVGNFDVACKMIDNGLGISFTNLQAEQLKNFSAFDWYHFAKFSERMLNSANKKFFEIAKSAVEIARADFLNYIEDFIKIPTYPDYITFSKMATCFDILDDTELSMKLHKMALIGADSDKGDDSAAFRLVILANELLTFEKHKNFDETDELRKKIQQNLNEYFKKVEIDSMKVPFVRWKESLYNVAEMSRAILL